LILEFQLLKKDLNSKARLGKLSLPHGEVPTPIFMPVGTAASIKSVTYHEMEQMQIPITLANSYHLYLRPGIEVIQSLGGLHTFCGWPKPILTDSGGFQVFSLSQMSKIDDDGYSFQSHLDGSRHRFTAASVYELQQGFGSDIAMPLDECLAFGSSEEKIKVSVNRTIAWAQITRDLMNQKGGTVFAIVQGEGVQSERERCAKSLVAMDFPGYAIGGLSVGESKDILYRMTDFTTDFLPEDKPRYLMGVGAPEDLLEGVSRGIDMFDCVLATRNARNATVYHYGGRLNLRNADLAKEEKPIDETCGCLTCRKHSRAYLRHLFKANEITGLTLATIHNVFFFDRLMKDIRQAIASSTFGPFKTEFLKRYQKSAKAEPL
jgi:queuine tRNA-ribosyltransferase